MIADLFEKALAALLAHNDDAGESALLIRNDSGIAWLARETSGERVALWRAPDDLPDDELATRFKAFVEQHNAQGAALFVVVVGGSAPAVLAAIRAARPRIELSPMGFYHLDEDASLTTVARKSAWLEGAVANVLTATPLDDAALEEHFARTRVVAAEQAQVAGKLRGRYGVTAALTAVCVAVFLVRFLWPDGGTSEHLLRMGANYGPRVREGEIYRLFASAFLHADILHLGANMIALWVFGPMLEALLGPRRYLFLYGASALVGALASALLTAPRMSVGASGAVWGLMTAGIAVVYRPRGLIPPGMLAAAKKRAWTPLVLNLAYSFRPGIDYLAHLGGGLVGAALILSGALLVGIPPLTAAAPASRRAVVSRQPVWTVLAALTALAMAASVLLGITRGKPWEAGRPPVLVRTPIADTGVSLELPDRIATRLKVDTTGGSPSYVYGAPDEDPFLFEIEIEPLDGPVPPESLEAELEGLRDSIGKAPSPDIRVVVPAHLDTVGGRRAVTIEAKLKNDVPVKSIFTVVGPRVVVVRAYGVGDRPKSWAGIEEKVAASLEAP